MSTQHDPLVSIVVPTFNTGPFLRPTIESALRQTMGDFELIVVDDGSTDGTLAELRSFDDPRIQIVAQANQGPPAALNTAFRIACGRYLGFLDHDDLWHETKLSKHVELMEQHPELDVTFSWSRLIGPNGEDLGSDPARWRGSITFLQLLEANPMGNESSLVMRRQAVQAVGGCDTRFVCCCDGYLMLRVASLRPDNVCAVPEELTYYRKHPSQQSRDWRTMQQEWFIMLEEFRQLDPAAVTRLEGRANSRRKRWYSSLAYKNGEYGHACRLVKEALYCDPAYFLADPFSWKVSAAALAGLLVPAALLHKLEAVAGVR